MRILRQYEGEALGAVTAAGFLYGTARLCGVDSIFPIEAERSPMLYPLLSIMYISFILSGARLGGIFQRCREYVGTEER